MPKPISTTMKVHKASGAMRERSAFTVGRWAGRQPSHETSEVCLFINDGAQATLVYRSPSLFGAVWRSTSGGSVHLATPNQMHQWQRVNDQWERTTQPLPAVISDLWGAWDDFALGWGVEKMIRWDGEAWSEMPSPGEVYAAHGPARDGLLAVGRAGLLSRWDGKAWEILPPPCSDSLIAVHASSDDDVWAIAKPGTLLHGSVSDLRPVLTSDTPLRAVARFLDVVYVTVEDTGLFRVEGDQLVLVKDTFKPVHLEARQDLLCAGGEAVVGTADGVKFTGSMLKVLGEIISTRPPLWT